MKSSIAIALILCALMAAAPAAASTNARAASTPQESAKRYVCPMHDDITSPTPGKCPKCQMDLREASNAAATAPPVDGAAGAAPADSKVQLQIPDANVYDQDGRKLKFYTDLIKGKTVAINFIFTTCTTICPPLSATMRKVQKDMSERVGRDVHLISVSVDPATDVPERLKSFAAKFNAGPGWTFVSGSKPEMDNLLRALGSYVGDKNDHTPMMLVGNDAASYWTRTYGLAPASTIIKVINEAAAKGAEAKKDSGESASVEVPMPAAGAKAKPKTPAEAAASYFPNLVVMTQDNKPVRFFDDLLKGKTVMINFVFTTCTGICPPMTANLAKVQEYLGDKVGRDVNMISISVDPLIDTPEVLKKYADSFKAKPGWYFLTGKKENIDWILHKVGGYVDDKVKHSSILIIGNVETGHFVKVFAMAKPAEIVDMVLKVSQPRQGE